MSRISINYSTESAYLANKAFDIGIYDSGSLLGKTTLGNGDNFQKELEPGKYQIKVIDPGDYTFVYLPGEEIELQDGIGKIYAMVENSKNSTASSEPVNWELYYTKSGSPAGEEPITSGTIPSLNPGELYTIGYNLEDYEFSDAGNYMFRLLNPGSDGSKSECWSGAIYCCGPITTTEAAISLVPNPGKLVISCRTTGDAPSGAWYEFIVNDTQNDHKEVSRNSLKAGSSYSVQLPPGSYQVIESKTNGAVSYSKSINGNIALGSGQTVYLTLTNRFPITKGALTISVSTEGNAPADSTYGFTIKGPEGTLTRTIKAGQTVSVDLTPGAYEVTESNTGGAAQVRKSPEGSITIKSGQTSNLKITNIYPSESEVQ